VGKVWVRALSILHVEENGVLKQRQPGDCFRANKQQALLWHAGGQAEIFQPGVRRGLLALANCGAVLRGPHAAETGEALRRQHGDELRVTVSEELSLPCARTLLWDASAPLRRELVPAGLALLERWELALVVPDYDALARDAGGEEDRALTGALVHDLRVPLYEPGVVFARRCRAALEFLEAWRAEPGDRRLSMLRALYKIKPLVLALPSVWMDGG
jgi:hypothetical protein